MSERVGILVEAGQVAPPPALPRRRRRTISSPGPSPLLGRAKTAGYFDDPKRLSRVHLDADFAAVRDHPAFVAFVRSLKQ